MKIPKHLGIIPDGNRRWACLHSLPKKAGYQYGIQPGIKTLQKAKELGIPEITYYGFTADNCKRPKEQVTAFQKACMEVVEEVAKEGAELLVIGNTQSTCFPKELLPYTKRTTLANGGIRLNLLINYSWKWDLSHCKQTGTPFSQEIPRMDLIMRWGNRTRLSGFLPVQSVYADFYSIKNLWPDYTEADFMDAIDWFQKQEDTLGG